MNLIRRDVGRLALGLALLALAAPRPALAVCGLTSGDFDGNGTTDLDIKGSAGPNTLNVGDSGTTVTVSLDCNGNGLFVDPGDVNGLAFPGVETFTIALLGRDTINYTQTAAWNGVVRSVLLTLGPLGNSVNFVGGSAIGGRSSLVVDVVGGANLDTLTVDFSGSTTTDSLLAFYGDLAGGPDTLNVKAPPANGASLDVNIAMGIGVNTSSVEAAGAVASSTLRTLIEGSAVFTQFDDYRASVSGSFSSNARFDYYCNLREGQDRFHAELPADSFAALTGAEVRIRCDGGPGLDLMSISDGGVAGPATVNGLVHGILRGGASLDTLSVDYLGVVGSGTFRARLSGGLQSDVVLLGLLADGGSSNVLDVAVQGARGNDTVFASVFDLGSASFGPLGGALADGGLDNGDACVVPGGTAAERINCEK